MIDAYTKVSYREAPSLKAGSLANLACQVATSAIAANTFQRSIFGAALPLVTPPLFHNLGIQYACTLLGGIAVLLGGTPFLFNIYGKR